MRLTAKGRVRDQALFLRPNGDKSEAWSAPFIKLSEVQAVLDKLAAYEDAEEQGLLVILPCKVGETVWRVNFDKRRKRIEEIRFDVNVYNAFGKTVFLTREEAEAALNGGQDDV